MSCDVLRVSSEAELFERFVSSVKNGINAFVDAGKVLVELVERDPLSLTRLGKKHSIPLATLKLFLDIGRGRLMPELIAAPPSIRNLSPKDQRLIVSGDVEALVMLKDGSVETIKVDLVNACKQMRDQVVGRRGIRTLDEQRMFLTARENVAVASMSRNGSFEKEKPWHVSGKSIVIDRPVKLSRADLGEMIASMR